MRGLSPVPKLLRVRRSKIHGRGVFAVRPIPKGTRIIEYAGERISPREADRRYEDGNQGHVHVLLFIVDRKTQIDAGVGGNEACFLNHSCDPNCEAVLDDKRIFIEAIRDIAPGVELTYDYNLQGPGVLSAEERRSYVCRCGAENCRGTQLARRRRRRAKPAARRGKKRPSSTRRRK